MWLSALLLVALTFYASLAVSYQPSGSSALPVGIIVLLLVVAPFGLFLWWLTLGEVLGGLLSQVGSEGGR